ncbi:MAG: hypothetical protein QW407_04240 [Thermofilaceae archaeon]
MDPFELLKALHALAAVDEARAIEVAKLCGIVGVPPEELNETLKSLREMNYVVLVENRVFLSELGILKVSSFFC